MDSFDWESELPELWQGYKEILPDIDEDKRIEVSSVCAAEKLIGIFNKKNDQLRAAIMAEVEAMIKAEVDAAIIAQLDAMKDGNK